MIGNLSSVLEKTALIKASSEIYSEHFSLIAERFRDPAKAYAIIEQVRGRIATDLLMAGSVTSDEARKTERAISQLRLKLIGARSTEEVRRIRDEIFIVEQSRWVTPEVSILKRQSHETVGLKQVEQTLFDSSAILEYVLANPLSYCLVILRRGSHIVPLADKDRVEIAVAAYLKAIKAKHSARVEARQLYMVLRPVPETAKKYNLVIVRDSQLHLVPFDGLIDLFGRYIAETHNVTYAPSATSFYLLAQEGRHRVKSRCAFGRWWDPLQP